MKRNSTRFLFVVVAMLFCLDSSLAQCPEDTLDSGECDTLHVIPWSDTLCESFPCFVRVPLLVTHDLLTADDSLAGFVIPLCYTHSNPSKYCSLSSYWNTTSVLSFYPDFERSIFRHVVEDTDTLYHNRMVDLGADFSGREWGTIILGLASDSSWHYWSAWPFDDSAFVPPYFWFCMIPTGTEDQRWWEGDRVLLATLTFRIEDTMHVCIDTTFWPPESALKFTDNKGRTFVPRHNMPVCFKVDTVGNGSAVQQLGGSENGKPHHFSLSQNYPNPFNPVTNIEFTLSKSACVRLEIFNILGQKVKTLIDNQKMSPGVYLADWDGKDKNGNVVSSGIYFYQIRTGDFSEVKKMIFLK